MRIRRFEKSDASQVSELICRNFREINIRDYPIEEMEQLAASYDVEKVLHIADTSNLYVVNNNTEVIGCGAIAYYQGQEDCILQTIFVKPEYQGQGIGKSIIQTLEQDEMFLKAKRIELHASITACEFYKKLGYEYLDGVRYLDSDGLYHMEKLNKK